MAHPQANRNHVKNEAFRDWKQLITSCAPLMNETPMKARRALISKNKLNQMAAVIAERRLVFEGRTSPNGHLTVRLLPATATHNFRESRLDDRLDDWAAR